MAQSKNDKLKNEGLVHTRSRDEGSHDGGRKNPKFLRKTNSGTWWAVAEEIGLIVNRPFWKVFWNEIRLDNDGRVTRRESNRKGTDSLIKIDNGKMRDWTVSSVKTRVARHCFFTAEMASRVGGSISAKSKIAMWVGKFVRKKRGKKI